MKKKTILVNDKQVDVIVGTQKKYDNKKGNFFSKRFDKKIIELVKSVSPKRILEIGCGEGHIVGLIKKEFPDVHYVGVDIDEGLLKLTKEKGANAVCLCGGEPLRLPLEKESFDLVLMIEVLEHMHLPERALKEAYRLSKSHLIASVPNEPLWRIVHFLLFQNITKFGNTPGHINHWGKKGFEKLITEKFEIKKFIKPFPWLVIHSEKK